MPLRSKTVDIIIIIIIVSLKRIAILCMLDSLITGGQYDGSSHGVSVPCDDTFVAHSPSIVGVRRDVLCIQAASGRQNAEKDLLPR